MTKRILLAILAVFITWSALDFVIHGLILSSTYQATAEFWRPMDEMKMGLMHLIVLISSILFVYIYAQFFGEKGLEPAVKYGIIFGLCTGISMGYGTYAVMPIPYKMALVWFLGTLVETTAGGVLLGLIVKE